MGFKVYNLDGEDVTQDRQWYIDPDGVLYYLTSDVDSPLIDAGDEFWIEDR